MLTYRAAFLEDCSWDRSMADGQAFLRKLMALSISQICQARLTLDISLQLTVFSIVYQTVCQ
jgi:hypothetical protein